MAFDKPGIELPFANGHYLSRSLQYSAQRCVGYYPSFAESGALTPFNLYPTSGISLIDSGVDGEINRASKNVGGVPYFVNGNNIYRLDRTVNPDLTETYTAVDVGNISGSRRVIMAASNTQFVAIEPDGSIAIHYDTTTGTVTDLTGVANFPSSVTDVVFLDGYFVFIETGTNKIFHSDLNQGDTYLALDFGFANQLKIAKGLMVYRNQLFVLGDDAMVPFANVGGLNFQFQARPSSVIDIGLRTVHAKCKAKGSFCFLGSSENSEVGVYMYSGGYPQKISTDTLDTQLQNFTFAQLDDAFMMFHSENGEDFVVITVGDKTFTYGITSSQLSGAKKWHERETTDGDTQTRWRVNSICQAYNKIFVGDYTDGRIGVMDEQVRTEYDGIVKRHFTLQPFDNKGKALRVSEIMLVMDAGFAGDMSMDFSKDGGYTWSNTLDRSAGEVGQYGKTVLWPKLGDSSFSMVLRFGTSTTAPCAVNKILAQA